MSQPTAGIAPAIASTTKAITATNDQYYQPAKIAEQLFGIVEAVGKILTNIYYGTHYGVDEVLWHINR